jgi:hypothetical protein
MGSEYIGGYGVMVSEPGERISERRKMVAEMESGLQMKEKTESLRMRANRIVGKSALPGQLNRLETMLAAVRLGGEVARYGKRHIGHSRGCGECDQR